MSILRPHAARYSTNGASLAWSLRPLMSMLTFTPGRRGPRAGRFIRFWASGGAKFTKMGDPYPERRWIAVRKLTPLAWSSAEKSVTVQTNKQHTNSKRYIHTLPIGMCITSGVGSCSRLQVSMSNAKAVFGRKFLSAIKNAHENYGFCG